MQSLAKKLPRAAFAKLAAANDQIEAWDAALGHKLSQIRAMETVISRSTDNPDDLQEAIERRDQLSRALDDLRERRNGFMKVFASVSHWVEMLPDGTVLQSAKRSTTAKLPKGQNFTEAVAAVRQEIALVKKERNAAVRCALPVADKKRLATDYVKSAAKRGQPLVIAEHGRPFAMTFDHSDTFNSRLDFGAMMAWLFPDAMIDRLHRDIEAAAGSDKRTAMTATERDQRMRDLDDQLLSLERREETLIEAAEDDGHFIARRVPDYPQAWLGVQIASGRTAPPARRVVASPG